MGQAPLTPAVFHILLALSETPLHGYGIMRRVEEASGLAMGPGTIYGSIRRLREAGWVDETDSESRDGRRGTTFALTDDGRRALTEEARRITRLAGMEGVRKLATDGGS